MTVDKEFFFNTVRQSLFGGALTEDQVRTMDAILDAASPSFDETAYMLATAYHEVGKAMKPISENLNYTAKRIREVWPSRFRTLDAAKPFANNPEGLANRVYGGRNGNDNPGDGWRYRGRGLPQVTFKDNYAKVGKAINLDLVGNPDLLLQHGPASRAMIVGMQRGLFTAKKLSDYQRPNGFDFIGARAIINADGKVNGGKIADHALKFRAGLREATIIPPELPAPTDPPLTTPPAAGSPDSHPTKLWAVLGTLVVGVGVAVLKALGIMG